MHPMKNAVIQLFEKFYWHEKIQSKIRQDIAQTTLFIPGDIKNITSEYSVSGSDKVSTRQRDDIIFITSRFRSGSTLLWNLFREVGDCTSYYEPFNERQWFNKTLRGNNVDSSHRGVDDYWAEYDGLERLSDFYKEDWINANLYMTEKSYDINMLNYIDTLIEHTDKRPVLQFNRIDFRLAWLRANYPNATVLHLYRHPRDQWYSFLTNKSEVTKDNIVDTYQDAFYLDVWCKDLVPFFPMLDAMQTPHPYQRFYYLWKLSWLWGKKFSHHSISFEELVTSTEKTIRDLMSKLNIDSDARQLGTLISPPKLGTWVDFANDNWFSAHEKECEDVLTSFFSTN
tara:strand:- start:1960 stop:2982 length:1023 start_codon:yes stop_codon:yes gene_type:complete